jgi:hypothetical protein
MFFLSYSRSHTYQARPKSHLGFIELELELSLAVAPAAAYVLFSDNHSMDDDDTSTVSTAAPQAGGEENEKVTQEKEMEQLQPKV